MINYEGIDYNLDTIIQFQFKALKKLLEALAKKQIEHNNIFFGQIKNISINGNEDNIFKGENEDENIYDKFMDKKNKIFYDKINHSGLIMELIESKKQMIEHKQMILELKSRIEALERDKKEKSNKNNNISKIDDENKEKEKEKVKEKEDKDNNNFIDKEKVNSNNENKNLDNNEKDNKDNVRNDNDNITEKENEYKEINDSKKDVTTIVENENKIIKNISTEEEINLKSQINDYEDNFRIIKEKIEKIEKETEINKKTIEVSQNEISQFKPLLKKFSDENNSQKEKDIDKNKKEKEENELNINLSKLEEKLVDLIEKKLKLNKISDNSTLKEFNAEKEKLKEDNLKIFSDIKNLISSNSEIKSKIMDLPNISAIKKIEEKLKIIGMELEECATKSDIKRVCDELDKYEKELSKIKSFIVAQNEKNEKNENEISKLKQSFDNVKKTFSSINKLLENNSLSDLLGNLGDLSKNMVDKEEHDKFIKEIKRKINDLQMDVDQNNRNLDEIMPLLKKILTADDLDKLQNSLTGLIEKQNADAMGKFANKKEIVKSIKSIESQVKIFMKNLDKEREKEKNESVILASKPVGGYKCASCEAYIGELKDSYSYIPWNKYHGSERPYRLGSSFSRILQGLNIDYTFNPFIHKNLIKNESSKKYFIKNNCSSVKKVKKILPFMRVPSEHDMVKNTTINEQFNMNSTSNNKRYQDSKYLWGNKTAKTSGNDYHWLKNKNKDNKNQQIKSVEKMFKVSKKVIKSKINNTSEDMENHYFMPNI